MTDSHLQRPVPRTPFIFGFAQRLPEITPKAIRYSSVNQVSQVLVGESWIDAPDATAELPETRVTEVRRETTDDR